MKDGQGWEYEFAALSKDYTSFVNTFYRPMLESMNIYATPSH